MLLNRRALMTGSLLLLLISPAFSQTDSSSEEFNFWEHLYMPIEMGLSFSTNPNQDPAYLVNSCLEYRFNRIKGWSIVGEYDEHTHTYTDIDIHETNTVKGDVKYTDLMTGLCWRQPLYKKISATAMLQAGMTFSTLKNVTLDTGEQYHLADNKVIVPTAKCCIGLEYVFDPSFNIYLHVGHTQHLKAIQLEHNKTKGVVNVSLGLNFSLF